jgi:glycogen debranching enzyme
MNVSQPVRADSPHETPFYIPAADSPSRFRYKIKHNDTFAVIDDHGDMGVAAGDPDGVFNHDTRYLSRFELFLNGQHALLLGSGVRDDNSVMTADLTNPDIHDERGEIILTKDSIYIVRTILIWHDTFYTRFGIRNFTNGRIKLKFDLAFANDFADLFEARGMRRQRRGQATSLKTSASDVKLSYKALDGEPSRMSLHFEPAPSHLTTSRARYECELGPSERRSIFVAAAIGRGPDQPPAKFFKSMRAMCRHNAREKRTMIGIGSSSDIFNQVISRSFADHRLLMTQTPEGEYP